MPVPQEFMSLSHSSTITFRSLFLYLLRAHGYLAIGLLRSKGLDTTSTKSTTYVLQDLYVATVPKPDTVIKPNDQVYVLAQNQPGKDAPPSTAAASNHEEL
mmetsp:Transcript_105651/g.182196  ORF Transcript_105651/g.182196 Transcript_105651/m.182196 type:complete len:101 (-) Transcript_105651:139-441(-)